jgi:digeranylgeranylglycerophospholipid reductase
MDYDVIIIGGGFAGLATAITASKNGAKCLVVEKEKELGYPVHTSGGSWYDEMLKLGLDERLLHPINSIAFHSPSGEIVSASFKDQDPYGCIIDVRRTIQFLAMKAAEEGAYILPNTKVLSSILENGEIIGVNIKSFNSEPKKIYSKIVVDASGSVSLITRQLGLKEGKWQRYGIGAEYEAYVPDLPDDNHVDFILGEKFAPAGYAWVFPTGKNRARIGVGIIRPDNTEHPFNYLEVVMHRHPNFSYLTHAVPIEYHTGIFPCEGTLPKTVLNRFISVGDAAGLGSPLVGEAIRYAIQFGYLAGEIAANAIAAADLSEDYLMQFEDKWKEQVETNFKIALEIQKRLASYSDADWEQNISM